MSSPNLPTAAIEWLASPSMREHHATWHYVRSLWSTLNAQQQQFYTDHGWRPPRFNPRNGAPDPGAGIDFLFMHRRMIKNLNELLSEIGEPTYPRVEGWSTIPWDHNSTDWPMPPSYDPGVDWAKDPAETERQRIQVEEKYENDEWLRTVSIDALGSEIENDIHNWMHVHWSAEPWFTGAPGQNRNDPRNDYLGSTYSSHVNKAFWKLHGWIDDRITQWEQANNQTVDFSQGWEGPHHGHIFEMADDDSDAQPAEALLNNMQRAISERFFVER